MEVRLPAYLEPVSVGEVVPFIVRIGLDGVEVRDKG